VAARKVGNHIGLPLPENDDIVATLSKKSFVMYYAFSATTRGKGGSGSNSGALVGARCIVPLRPRWRIFPSYQHVCISCAL